MSGAVTVAAVPTAFTVTWPPPLPLELPVTCSPPSAPVLLSTMPFAPPVELMLVNVKPSEWMVVELTFSAVPAVVVMVLLGAVPVPFGSVTATVPPLDAMKALAVFDNARPPSKRVRLAVALLCSAIWLVRAA